MHALIPTSSLLAALGLLPLALGACGDDEGGGGTTTDDHHHESSGSTTHEDHGSGTATDPTGDTTAGGSGTTDGYQPPSAQGYCDCMLDVCHDLYHATWGEDHVASEMMCLASFDASPSAGMPATEGDSKECRAYHCEAAARDETLCESALGGGVCQ